MPAAALLDILALFQQNLVGDWENKPLPGGADGAGGPANPLSYNIMPLPETADPDGYILKNFRYHEKLHFNNADPTTTLAIAARAPNRGGTVNQDARAIFYEQQVKFAEGPQGPERRRPMATSCMLRTAPGCGCQGSFKGRVRIRPFRQAATIFLRRHKWSPNRFSSPPTS